MKAFSLLCLALSTTLAFAQAPDSSASTLSLPSMRYRESNALALAPSLKSATKSLTLEDGAKKGQLWILLSYELFSGDKAGNEFGFTPTSILGYQRNFYPSGRIKNALGYALGVGLFNAGAAVFYHQGSANRVDFRAGIGVDVIYLGSFFGTAVYPTAFANWGVKV